MPTYFYGVLTAIVVAIILLVISVLIGRVNYKDFANEKYTFSRNFPFELQSDNEDNKRLVIRVLTPLMFAAISVAYILMYANYYSLYVLAIMIGVFGTLSSLAMATLFFVDTKIVKLHLFTFGANLIFTLLNAILVSWFCFVIPKTTTTVPIACVLFVLQAALLILAINPKLKSWAVLNKVTNDDGSVTYVRPKQFALAYSEWIIVAFNFIILICSFALYMIG